MKNLLLGILFALFANAVHALDMTGDWLLLTDDGVNKVHPRCVVFTTDDWFTDPGWGSGEYSSAVEGNLQASAINNTAEGIYEGFLTLERLPSPDGKTHETRDPESFNRDVWHGTWKVTKDGKVLSTKRATLWQGCHVFP